MEAQTKDIAIRNAAAKRDLDGAEPALIAAMESVSGVTKDNTNTLIPKVSIDDRNGNRRPSTRFLYDGSYMRIRNISLGYDLKKLLRLDQVMAFRVYLTVQNALTFTKYPGLDPEIQANANDTRGLGLSSDLAVGIDWGTVPSPRTFVAGIKVDF